MRRKRFISIGVAFQESDEEYAGRLADAIRAMVAKDQVEAEVIVILSPGGGVAIEEPR